MIKEITKREFEERYPEVYISDAGQVAAYLENNAVLQYDVIGYEEV